MVFGFCAKKKKTVLVCAAVSAALIIQRQGLLSLDAVDESIYKLHLLCIFRFKNRRIANSFMRIYDI